MVALTPSPSADDLRTLPPRTRRRALLVGAEGGGLSAAALAAADRRVRIAMAPGVDSLNVATAAAIALHHLAAARPVTLRRLQVEEAVEADGEAGVVGHRLDRQQDAGHERVAVVGVVADRQALAGGAEQHLLVGDQAPQAHGVDPDAGRARAAPGALDHRALGRVVAPSRPTPRPCARR